MNVHFHAGFNVPGTLPESDPTVHLTFTSAADALSYELHYAAESAPTDEQAEPFEAAADEVLHIVPTRLFDGYSYYGSDGYNYWIEPCGDACEVHDV